MARIRGLGRSRYLQLKPEGKEVYSREAVPILQGKGLFVLRGSAAFLKEEIIKEGKKETRLTIMLGSMIKKSGGGKSKRKKSEKQLNDETKGLILKEKRGNTMYGKAKRLKEISPPPRIIRKVK